MQRRRLLRSTLATAGLAMLPRLYATAPAWQQAQPLPLKTQELYPAVHQGRLYVAGGIAARMGVPYFTDRCVSYDDVSNTWREEPALPMPLHHAALASTGKALVLAGGFNGGYAHIWQMSSAVFQLHAKEWEPLPALPQPQAEGVFATASSGALHLVGGQSLKGEANSARSDHQEVGDHWVWAGGGLRWEALAPLPTVRNSATGGWLGDQLVVTGGRTEAGNLTVTEVYDAAEDRWRTAAPMPQPQAGTASVVVGDSLLVFGGEIFVPEPAVFAQAWRYTLSTDRWEPLPALGTPRHGLGAGLLNGKVYLVGGATQPSGRGTSDLNEVMALESLLASGLAGLSPS